jgi:hypothetical protein
MSAAVTISATLLDDIKRLLLVATQDRDAVTPRPGENYQTSHALGTYILAVASVEAFLNEVFLERKMFGLAGQAQPVAVDLSGLERLDIREKLVLFPLLTLGKTLDRGRQPYQDMAVLVRLRNDLVHYKMRTQTPGYLTRLRELGVAQEPDLEFSDPARHGIYGWTEEISTLRGILWAHNIVCATVKALGDLMPEDDCDRDLVINFQEILERRPGH